MADFCSQCSLEIFLEDSKDLTGFARGGYKDVKYLHTLCEDCGDTIVDNQGVCVGDCLKHHGARKVLKLKRKLGEYERV